MSEDSKPKAPAKKAEKKRDLVEIHLSEKWSYKDRLNWLIKGAQLSVDEIIKSLHQPMELETNRDASYKSVTSGREEAIITASNIMINIERLTKSHSKATIEGSGIEGEKEFSEGFAEQHAQGKKIE